jgi:hypothetical protein
VPAENVRQNPAEDDAEAPAAGHHEAEHAHRLRPLARLREQHHDERQRDGRHDRAADALDGAGADEEPLSRRNTACDRRKREDEDPDEEEPAVAEEVAEPAAEEEEAAEGKEVGVDDPGE